MNELKIDNPAQRLLDILEAGKKQSTSQNCRVVWISLLKAQHNNEQHILSRLARVMELPGRIVQVREDHFSTLRGKSMHWKKCVDQAFVSQSLNNSWHSFWQHIDDRTLSELGMLSDLFETRGAHAAMKSEDINALLEKLTELRSEIREAELPAMMKTLLLKQLSQIQEALETYGISGVEPVMDAVQSTLGLAVLDQEYRNEISKGTNSKFGEKISSLLNEVANVITVACVLPALPVAVSAALTYMSQ